MCQRIHGGSISIYDGNVIVVPRTNAPPTPKQMLLLDFNYLVYLYTVWYMVDVIQVTKQCFKVSVPQLRVVCLSMYISD